MITIGGFAQTQNNFVCEKFSLSYPSTYKKVAIINAPHMKLKLQDNQRLFTASYWNKGCPPNVSIWDDEIYDSYLNMPVKNGNVVSVERCSIKIKDGVQKCLRIKTNYYEQNLQMHVIMFLMLKNSYLYIFGFHAVGKCNEKTSTYYEENFLTGLSLFNNEETNSDEELYNYLVEAIKTINAQCPIRPDNCITYRNVLLSGKTIIVKVIIDGNCLDYILDEDFENFKNRLTKNFAKALEPRFIDYLHLKKYNLTYTFYDEDDNLLKLVKIDTKDMINNEVK